jgi:hypothetical protein
MTFPLMFAYEDQISLTIGHQNLLLSSL